MATRKSFAEQLNPALAFLSVPTQEPQQLAPAVEDDTAPASVTPSAGTALKRIQILLPAEMLDQLRTESARTGASVSELIRNTIRVQYPETEPVKKSLFEEGDPMKTYSISELKEILHVSTPTVYGLIHSGKLKAIKCGRAWIVTEDELRRYLAGSAS